MGRRTWTGAVLAAVIALAGCEDIGSVAGKGPPSEADAEQMLDEVIAASVWREETVAGTRSVDITAEADLAKTLPPIDEFPLTVEPGGLRAEICASSEKAGTGTDGWMNETAKAFNAKGIKTSGGHFSKVAIRKVASGTCHEYIASGRYVPDGFSPSNVLWVKMVEARGTPMKKVAERLVGNTGGIVMKTEVAEAIKAKRGGLGVGQVIEAVAAGDIAMGYTNPYASSTGLNMLQTALATYAEGDESKMNDPSVVSAFEAFQQGVPFVALTTMQMRDAVGDKGADGPLDAFVMERQTFDKVDAFRTGWEYIPFGVRHDNPLYAVASASSEKHEMMEAFARYALSEASQTRASEYGFNAAADASYKGPYAVPSGQTLRRAQRLWKEKKDAGRPIIAVFVVDVSGSMGGSPIAEVRKAMAKGAEFISPSTAVGVVTFNHEAVVRLPVRKFDLQHKARFLAAADELEDGGGTAMYDAVALAIRLARTAKTGELTNGKIRLLVLSDGESKNGHGLKHLAPIVETLNVPVYTIAYGSNANTAELAALSGLAEAAALKANEARIAHTIGPLVNAQL